MNPHDDDLIYHTPDVVGLVVFAFLIGILATMFVYECCCGEQRKTKGIEDTTPKKDVCEEEEVEEETSSRHGAYP